MTLRETIQAVTLIREAIDGLETRGERNASLVVYTTRKCNEVIQAIQNHLTEKEEARKDESDSD